VSPGRRFVPTASPGPLAAVPDGPIAWHERLCKSRQAAERRTPGNVDVNPRTREDFDRNLERVLDRLPAAIRGLLDDVPLHVEDYPSTEVLERTGVARREWLCGLYTGIPLTERSVEQSRPAPDVVTLYREGILHLTADAEGYVTERALQRQIRITLLHELGHHHGLSEEDLREMGYQ